MKKKISSFLLALSMLMTYVTAVYAVEGRTEIYSSDQFAEGGQEITVPVSVRGNAGFDNFVIELEYDPNVLTPTDEPAVPGELLTVVPEVEKTPGEIIFSASQAVSADGQLFTYKFKVNESVTTRVVSPIIINVKELSITTDGTKAHVENDAFGCSITINKDVVTQTEVQISNTEADYDGQLHGVDVSLNYDVAYEVLYNGTKDVPVNAGTYNVEVTVTEEGYTGTATGIMTINPAPVAVRALDAKKGEGGIDPELSYVTEGTLYEGAAFSGALSREPGEAVGTYEITQGTLALDQNYDISYTPGTFTIIDMLPQNVTVEDIAAKTYGDEPFKLNVTYDAESGLTQTSYESSDTSVATVSEDGTVTIVGAGTTLIKVTVAGSDTYSEAVITKELNVGKANLTVTANTMAMTYGDPVPEGFITYEGLVNGDTEAALPVDLESIGAKPAAGTYAYTPIGIETNNYNVTCIPGTLTVNKRTLSVGGLQVFDKLADGTTAGTVNASSAVLSGLVEGDNVTLDTSNLTATFASAELGQDIAVTISGIAITGTDAGNYALATTTFQTTASIKETLTAAEIAMQIGGGSIVGKNATEITLPSIPDSHTITLASSSDEAVISLDGKIHTPAVDTYVDLIFTITNKEDPADTANTAPIQVLIYCTTKVEVRVSAETAGGTVSGGGLYDAGSQVTVTASPESSYRFLLWKKDGTIVQRDLTSYTFTATRDTVITARFVKRNTGGGLLGYNNSSSSVKASVSSGTVIRGTEVELTTSASNARIYYTTDNSTPTDDSIRYTGPITISENMTIKAISVQNGRASSVKTLRYTVRNPKAELKSGASSIKYMAAYGNEFFPDESATRYEVLEALNYLFDVEQGTTEKEFSDVAAEDEELVNKFASVGIINGYDDGTFGGNRGITRAEFVTILNNTLNNTDVSTTTDRFSDIATHWAREYINAFANLNYVSGYPGGTFKPDNQVTRAEVVSVLNRIAGIKSVSSAQVYDDLPSTHWAFGQIMAAAF